MAHHAVLHQPLECTLGGDTLTVTHGTQTAADRGDDGGGDMRRAGSETCTCLEAQVSGTPGVGRARPGAEESVRGAPTPRPGQTPAPDLSPRPAGEWCVGAEC